MSLTNGEPKKQTAEERALEIRTPCRGCTELRTSLPCATLLERARVGLSISGGGEKSKLWRGRPFYLRHWIIHPSEMEDPKTGEVRWIQRQILICADGTRIACASDGITQSLLDLTLSAGPAPWDLGVPLVIRERPVASGGDWTYLDFAE